MAKKKKKGGGRGRGAGGGGGHPSAVRSDRGAGTPAEEEDEDALPVDLDSEEVLQQQQRLLAHFEAQKRRAEGAEEEEAAGDEPAAAGSCGHSSEDLFREQRKLLAHFEAQRRGQDGGAADVEGSADVDRTDVAAEPEATAPSGPAAGSTQIFATRRINFMAREVSVLLQNTDGPCALLAVANALILRGTLSLGKDEKEIDSGELVKRLSRLCESCNAKAMKEDPNTKETVTYLTGRMPKFMDGLFLNCCFSGCSEFEYTADLALFDCFGLQLYHLWVDKEVSDVAASWNALADRLAACAEMRCDLAQRGCKPSPEEDRLLAQGLCLQQFVDEHSTQATVAGLREFSDALGEGQVCVLFRNNHFNTVYRPRPGLLCVLLANVAFDGIDDAVWESLEEGDDSGEILNKDFKPGSAGGAGDGGGGGWQTVRSRNGAAKDEELLRQVMDLGFSRSLAQAGLAAVSWSGADEAIQAILDADCNEAKLEKMAPAPRGRVSNFGIFECPSCGKKVSTQNGLLNHRAAKGH